MRNPGEEGKWEERCPGASRAVLQEVVPCWRLAPGGIIAPVLWRGSKEREKQGKCKE
jgi:hypothetical protein